MTQSALQTTLRYQQVIMNIRGGFAYWLLNPKKYEEKKAHQVNLNRAYPEVKENLLICSKNLKHEEFSEIVSSILSEYKVIDYYQRTLISSLSEPENYQNKKSFNRSLTTYNGVLLNSYQTIIDQSQEALDIIEKLQASATQSNKKGELLKIQTQLGVNLFFFLFGVIFSIRKAKQLRRYFGTVNHQLQHTNDRNHEAFSQLEKDLPTELMFIHNKLKEIGDKLEDIYVFIEEVGKGNFSHNFRNLNKKDRLGNSLLSMRDNLQKAYEEDLIRNWSTEGQAKFATILRENNDNIGVLSDNILSHLIDYLQANQGNLFILKENLDESFMQLEACFAWDKKKFHAQKIYIGDGLIGQSWIERDTIFLTDIPKNFISITSGIGKALPSCILIVPLISNEKVYGVIEIASFEVFKDHEVEFVQKLSESIASTISNARGYEQTQKLLEESKELTEQMRAQEEEMRQNMEELQATQEEMFRKELNSQNKSHIIDQSQWLIELDEKFFVKDTNRLAATDLGYPSEDLANIPFGKILSDDSPLSLMKDLAGHDVLSQVWKFLTRGGRTLLIKITVGVHTDPLTDERIYSVYGTNITNLAVTEA